MTRPVPSGRCPFSSALSIFRRVGLPIGLHSVRLSLATASNLLIFPSLSTASDPPTFTGLATASGLLIFSGLATASNLSGLLRLFHCIRSLDLLRLPDRFRSSCKSNLAAGELLSNGESKVLPKLALVKA